jgi:hypothetical protein
MFKVNQKLKVTTNGERITVLIKEVNKDYLWVENLETEISFPINEWDIQHYNVEVIQ